MTTTNKFLPNMSEAGIFGRILSNGNGEMSHALARYVLTLGFSDADQARMEDLAARNQLNALTALEHTELMNFVRAGHLLALLHSKARKSLRKRKVS
jgi:hypothetical protein